MTPRRDLVYRVLSLSVPIRGSDAKTLDRQQRQAQIKKQAQRAGERGLVPELSGDLRYRRLIGPALSSNGGATHGFGPGFVQVALDVYLVGG